MKFASITSFLLFLSYYSFAGFAAGTLVKTSHNCVLIENIQIGDYVQCCAVDHLNAVLHKQSKKVAHALHITFNETYTDIIASPDQKFYVLQEYAWKLAQDLHSGDYLLKQNGERLRIKDIQRIEQELQLYDLTIDQCHTFFVTEHAILVHNVGPIVISLAWALGNGIEFLWATLGVSVLGTIIGLNIERQQKKHLFTVSTPHNKLGISPEASPCQCGCKCFDQACGCKCGCSCKKEEKRIFNKITKQEFFKSDIIKRNYEHYRDGIYRLKWPLLKMHIIFNGIIYTTMWKSIANH